MGGGAGCARWRQQKKYRRRVAFNMPWSTINAEFAPNNKNAPRKARSIQSLAWSKLMLPPVKIILLLCALWPGAAAWAAQADTPAAPDDAQKTAKTLLLDMATLLGDAQSFTVDLRSGYDAMQANGQKIEFGELRQLSVERPTLLLSELRNSDGSTETTLFDGKWITVSHSGDNVYARAPQPGDIDASLKFFVNDLGMRLPLAIMLMSHFADEVSRRTADIAYVEETDILGEPAHHIAGRTRNVDYQVWISAGKRPLPLRIILTYREAAGEPQFWANFSNWNFNPSFLQKTFRFEPPANAREVPLVANFTRVAATPAASTPSAAGAQP